MIKFNYTATNTKALMKLSKQKYFEYMITEDSVIILSSTDLLMFDRDDDLINFLISFKLPKLDAHKVDVVKNYNQNELIRIKYSDFEKGEIPELIRYKYEGREYYFNHSLFLPCIKAKRSGYKFGIYTYGEYTHGVNIYDREGNYCGLILGMRV